MLKHICLKIYALPLENIVGYMISFLFLWVIAEMLFSRKLRKPLIWRLINSVTLFATLGVIAIVTLTARSGSASELILIPFYSFIEARIQPELYRSMLMNVFLFFPLGLTLPYALPEKWNRKVLLSILFAMVLSIGIEFTQYHFHLGRAEIDDVICNTLGCAIGTISYYLASRSSNKNA